MTDKNPKVVSKWSWPMWADKIHAWFMYNMGIWGYHSSKKERQGTGVFVNSDLLELIFLAVALPGEVGEMCNDVKKIWRDGRTPELVAKLSKEVADVRIYLHHIEAWLEADPNEICASKLRELMERWPHIAEGIGYSDQAKNRASEGGTAHQP